jgi:BCD family chlorophyll transporter-like MFS transporter
MEKVQFGWLGVVRLGLVQTSLGAIVVLTTSTINRVMVVELALPAMIPGALVALHYALQILRPRVGHGSDTTRRRTPWIIGGMAVLTFGGIAAAAATALMTVNFYAGLALAVVAFALIGGGVSAAGTTLLVLLAKLTPPARRPAAATIVWLMMIAGFAVTAIIVGQLLDPFSFVRLVTLAIVVGLAALLITVLALGNIETVTAPGVVAEPTEASTDRDFGAALRSTWSDPKARLFTIFIFMSMLAYSMQDLILEPFAGIVFGYTPGQSTSLSGVHHGGVFTGMVLVGICGTLIGGRLFGSLRLWMVTGCIASAVALAGIVTAAMTGAGTILRPCVFALGVANGAFAIAAISTMMSMAGEGQKGREGIRMGLWGAAQGIAFGMGGFFGTVAIDVARLAIATPASAYAIVFAMEGALFLLAASIAYRLDARNAWAEAGLPRLAWSIGMPRLATGPLKRSAIDD